MKAKVTVNETSSSLERTNLNKSETVRLLFKLAKYRVVLSASDFCKHT